MKDCDTSRQEAIIQVCLELVTYLYTIVVRECFYRFVIIGIIPSQNLHLSK
jgi:hypothetical protein